MRRHRAGVIVGKFLPPHAGHHHLIETARASCDELTVLLVSRSDEPIPIELRREWLMAEHPDVRVLATVDDHRVDFDDDATWRHWTDAMLRLYRSAGAVGDPDAVFSSEPYGEEMARRLGAAHVMVDLERARFPVSGTRVREDPFAAWPFLRAAVRAFFVKRVAMVGAESTGKTTLATALAQRLETVWVREYGRDYSEVRGLEAKWTSDEFVRIATRQNELEDEAARTASRVLICDTDALATCVWHERYVGSRCDAVERLVRPLDLYLVTAPDVPWVDDGLRDGEHVRQWMHTQFVQMLRERGARFEVLTGTWDERERAAMAAVERALREPWRGASYRPIERGGYRPL